LTRLKALFFNNPVVVYRLLLAENRKSNHVIVINFML